MYYELFLINCGDPLMNIIVIYHKTEEMKKSNKFDVPGFQVIISKNIPFTQREGEAFRYTKFYEIHSAKLNRKKKLRNKYSKHYLIGVFTCSFFPQKFFHFIILVPKRPHFSPQLLVFPF